MGYPERMDKEGMDETDIPKFDEPVTEADRLAAAQARLGLIVEASFARLAQSMIDKVSHRLNVRRREMMGKATALDYRALKDQAVFGSQLGSRTAAAHFAAESSERDDVAGMLLPSIASARFSLFKIVSADEGLHSLLASDLRSGEEKTFVAARRYPQGTVVAAWVVPLRESWIAAPGALPVPHAFLPKLRDELMIHYPLLTEDWTSLRDLSDEREARFAALTARTLLDLGLGQMIRTGSRPS
jgi:hypothetical protein